MKIRVTFRTPDAVEDAILKEVTAAVSGRYNSEEDRIQEAGTLKRNAWRSIDRWVRHGENLVVLFDTDTGTAEVVPK